MYFIFIVVCNFYNEYGEDTTNFIILQMRKLRPREFKSTVQVTQQ